MEDGGTKAGGEEQNGDRQIGPNYSREIEQRDGPSVRPSAMYGNLKVPSYLL